MVPDLGPLPLFLVFLLLVVVECGFTRGGVVYSRNLHVVTRDTSFPSCHQITQLTRVYNLLRSPLVPRFYPLNHS